MTQQPQGWEIDPIRREIRRGGRPVPLGERAFEIVQVLVGAAGELVPKDTLMERIWPGAVVEENTLQVHISAIRKALGTDRGLLQTASGRGYRLLGRWSVREERQTQAHAPAYRASLGPASRPGLPQPATEIIGRDAALREIADLLSAYRIVSLIGTAGIGKTSLALEAARRLAERFEDGAQLVELAAVTDPGLVPSALAAALGLPPGDAAISAASVARAIGDRAMLLVIDNVEHVVVEVAHMAEAIAATCPRVAVLVTGREMLGIDGERGYQVRPLDLAARPAADGAGWRGSSAVELFIARMTAQASPEPLGPAALDTIAAICRRLDCIPLAIEFAASRAATLGLDQVVRRLDDRFGLLQGGRRTALTRHQTLRAALDWSHDLLSPAEQAMLRRLSIFAGGFTLDGAMAVMEATPDAPHAVLDSLSGLVAKSLVVVEAGAAEMRWRMLETIRAYGLERLREAGEMPRVARRHADHVLAGLLRSDPAGAPRPTASPRALREVDNLRAAFDWAASPQGDPVLAASLAAAGVPVWLRLSLIDECRDRVEVALDGMKGRAHPDPRVLLRLYVALGTTSSHRPDSRADAAEAASRALAIAESLGDLDAMVRALWGAWSHQTNSRDFRAAEATSLQLARVVREAGHEPGIRIASRLCGNTLHFRGRHAEARRHLEQSLLLHRQGGARQDAIYLSDHVAAQTMLARALFLSGFVDQGRIAARTGLAAAEAESHDLSVCYALGLAVAPLALLACELDEAERAVDMLERIAGASGLRLGAAWASFHRAELLIRRGAVENGHAMMQRALDAHIPSNLVMPQPYPLGVLAQALARLGQSGMARSVVEEALAVAERNGEEWCLPELLRIRGEILVAASGPDAGAVAEDSLKEPVQLARGQGALFWELRAATSLARRLRREGRGGEALRDLAAVVERFPEGFGSADVRAALEVLGRAPPAA